MSDLSRPTFGSSPATSSNPSQGKVRPVGLWLLTIAILIAVMVSIGGLTRLTHSGLSMVEWRPVTGWLPPLTQAAWQSEFDKYQLFPEYQKLNLGISLAEFQEIYWLEFIHRLFGRLIGLIFVIPFGIFLWQKRIDRVLAPKLAAIFLLGAAQGALGWYMVASGLVDIPHVSHYRLTAHLGLAVFLFAAILWTAFGLLGRPSALNGQAPGAAMAHLLVGLVFLQILAGGLVAGLNAGMGYNTWPLMDGSVIPDGLFIAQPWWTNFIDNALTVQFQHRLGAYAIAVLAVYGWWRTRYAASDGLCQAGRLLLAAVALQVLLGIVTLLTMVPVPLAALHQAGALLLLCATLWFLYQARRA